MGRVLILGGGRQGSFIAEKLKKLGHEVVVWDLRKEVEERLRGSGVGFERKNLLLLENPEAELSGYQLVVDALPGEVGFKALERLVELGKRAVSISFGKEDYLLLNKRAENTGAVVVPDAGIAPGLTNLLAGFAFYRMGRAESLRIWVGGIPKDPLPPFYHNLTWSVEDLLEEYTRPARVKEYGILKNLVPLNHIKDELDFPVKPLASFPTDGLRSLLYTLPIPNMEERTLRYKEHLKAMKTLHSLGFLDDGLSLSFANFSIPVKTLTGRVLEEKFSSFPTEDLLVGRVEVVGSRKYVFDFFAEYDYERGITAMARGTGTVAVCFVEELLKGQVEKGGIYPPETFGKRPELVAGVFKALEEEGIKVNSR